jgi:glycosyltransferase involved in cell wall biosynthesis
MPQVEISAVLSIHNRGQLFGRALAGYLWQTLPPEQWEIVLIDDCSTEDLSKTYEHLIGKINLRHVELDHKLHPLWKKRNPTWKPGEREDWFHTPALTINAGTALARGEVIALCHPEILHAPENFAHARERLIAKKEKSYLFGLTWLGDGETNRWLSSHERDWTSVGWEGFLQAVNARGGLQHFGPQELYWYTSFLPKAAIEAIRGVDFVYLEGVAAEDDDFRDRVALAGWAPVYATEIQGLHQDHSAEPEAHRNRTSVQWGEGLNRNRQVYFQRRNNQQYPKVVNTEHPWYAVECVTNIREYRVGATQ